MNPNYTTTGNAYTESLVLNGLKGAKWNEQIMQAKLVTKNIDFYKNNQMPYIKAVMQARMDGAEYANILPLVTYYPLTKQIIDEISIMFQNGYNVSLVNDGVVDDDKSILLETRLADFGLDSILQKTNAMAELTGSCAVLPVTKDGTIKLYTITRDRFFVEADKQYPDEMTAFYYSIGEATQSPASINKACTFMKLTNDYTQEVVINMANGETVGESVKVTNPLGRIPVVIFTNETTDMDILPDTIIPVADLNLDINRLITDHNNIIDMQSFSTLVLSGAGQIDGLKYGVNHVIELESQSLDDGTVTIPTAQFISPNAKLTELDGIISTRMERAASAFGIGSNAFKNDSSAYSSGYQLKLSKEDIINSTIRKSPLYSHNLEALIGNIIELYNIANPTDMIVGYNRISVTISKPTYDVSDSEKQDLFTKELANGLTSQVRILMATYNITRDDAMIMYRELLEEKALEPIDSTIIEPTTPITN